MILDSLLAMLLSGLLSSVDTSAPPGWVLDSVVVTMSYEIEILTDETDSVNFGALPDLAFLSREFSVGAQHPWLFTSEPLDLWRLHEQWGVESGLSGTGGYYAFNRHPLGSGWDLRLAVVHESVPVHAQEARWSIAHGLF